MSKRPLTTWPEGLSLKLKRSISGRRGRAKSDWRNGFDGPLSVADTEAWVQRKATPRKL
jgi:hypothetical protein